MFIVFIILNYFFILLHKYVMIRQNASEDLWRSFFFIWLATLHSDQLLICKPMFSYSLWLFQSIGNSKLSLKCLISYFILLATLNGNHILIGQDRIILLLLLLGACRKTFGRMCEVEVEVEELLQCGKKVVWDS